MNQPSVLIITFNEEINLPGCLASIGDFGQDVWVVDAYSTDRTTTIARQWGANVVQHAWEGYAAQKNWALSSLGMKNAWVLILDADERLTPELRNEIQQVLADPNKRDGYYVNRRFLFYGKWIKHCGWYPSWNLRLFDLSLGKYENRIVDEHLLLDGTAGYLKSDMIHEDLRDLEFWIAKHNRYSTYNAQIYYELKQRTTPGGITPNLWGTQAERKRFLKEKIYCKLPARSLFLFIYMYFIRLGFLDGAQGFMFCAMHAVFQYFNKVKLWELEGFKHGAASGAINPYGAAEDRRRSAHS